MSLSKEITAEQRDKLSASRRCLVVGCTGTLIRTDVKTGSPDIVTEVYQHGKECSCKWSKREIRELITRAVDLEQLYATKACPDEIVGMSAEQFADYVEYVGDRRFGQLGMDEEYSTPNPFGWMSEQTDLNRETNFFEAQVTEYQSGGSLDW